MGLRLGSPAPSDLLWMPRMYGTRVAEALVASPEDQRLRAAEFVTGAMAEHAGAPP